MRVLVCPTAFKESLSATEVADAIAAGVRRAIPAAGIRTMPLSDGGSGLIETLAAAAGGREARISTTDPLGRPVEARVLWTDAEAVVIESAEACGLHLLAPKERVPLQTATDGVGALLERCAADGARRAILGLGGSATVDGGTGMARALGWRFLDVDGRKLAPGGASLEALAGIIPPSEPLQLEITTLADVRSPLLGPDGAARRFAPQQGAGPREVETLERGLARLAEVVAAISGVDLGALPGAGAAGGLGFGMVAFAGSRLVDGSDWVMKRTGFDEALADTDLVVTGEGAWDPTSRLGKIPERVTRRARDRDVAALLVCGRIDGPVPEGIRAVGGDGEMLDADGVASMVETALRT